MVQINPEFVRIKGRTELVVLTYRQFLKIQAALEDAADLVALRSARREDMGKANYTPDETREYLGRKARGTKKKPPATKRVRSSKRG